MKSTFNTPATSSFLPSSASRFLYLEDGRTIGCFTSISTHQQQQQTFLRSAVLLEGSGAKCTILEADGSIHRHMTRFPLHTFQSRLAATLHFRNQHAPRPYLCRTLLLREQQQGMEDDAEDEPRPPRAFLLDSHPLAVHWPEKLEEGEGGGSKRRLYSQERNAWIEFECQSRVVRAGYYVEVPAGEGDGGRTEGMTFQSSRSSKTSSPLTTWIERIFPVDNPPACFAYPVQVLLRQHPSSSSSAAATSSLLPSPYSLEEEEQESLPWSLVTPSDRDSIDAERCLLPVDIITLCYSHPPPSRQVQEEDARRTSLALPTPKQAIVKIEENHMGRYWVVGEGKETEGKGKVLVQVKADDSCLEVEGGFCRRIPTEEGSSGSRIYDIEAIDHLHIPSLSKGPEGGYNLGEISKHGHALFRKQESHQSINTGSSVQPSIRGAVEEGRPEGPGPLIEQAIVKGVGVFRAFANGKVLVRFEDRTILELNESKGVCTLLLPDAVTLTLPLERWSLMTEGPDAQYLYQYGRPALEFAKWAYLTPQQREEVLYEIDERRARITQEMQRMKVFIGLNTLQTTGKLPSMMAPSLLPPPSSSTSLSPSFSLQGDGNVSLSPQEKALDLLDQVSSRNKAQIESIQSFLRLCSANL